MNLYQVTHSVSINQPDSPSYMDLQNRMVMASSIREALDKYEAWANRQQSNTIEYREVTAVKIYQVGGMEVIT